MIELNWTEPINEKRQKKISPVQIRRTITKTVIMMVPKEHKDAKCNQFSVRN